MLILIMNIYKKHFMNLKQRQTPSQIQAKIHEFAMQ